jgi:hypothetical protein
MKPQMTAPDLKEFVEDLIVFLQALDKLLPNKVDADLISFLQGVEAHPWLSEIMLRVLSRK